MLKLQQCEGVRSACKSRAQVSTGRGRVNFVWIWHSLTRSKLMRVLWIIIIIISGRRRKREQIDESRLASPNFNRDLVFILCSLVIDDVHSNCLSFCLFVSLLFIVHGEL